MPVRSISKAVAVEDMKTCLKRGDCGANTPVILIDLSNSLTFGKKKRQKWARGFLLNKCKNFVKQSI
jgi:hypothetical protein